MIGNKFHFNTPLIISTKNIFPQNPPAAYLPKLWRRRGDLGGAKVNFEQTLFNINFAGFQEKNALRMCRRNWRGRCLRGEGALLGDRRSAPDFI